MLEGFKGWIECSLLDWPGRVAAVVFLPGCNFRCPFCHNPSLVLEPSALHDISLEEVLSHCRTRSAWVDGIVVSGGEPTVHPGLPGLLERIKSEGLGVKLDTNGSRPDVLLSLLEQGLVDHVAMDLKAPLESEKYSLLAGVAADIGALRLSLDLLVGSGVPHTFRSTVVPGVHSDADIEEMAAALPRGEELALQAYRPQGAMDPLWRDIPRLTEGELARLSRLVRTVPPAAGTVPWAAPGPAPGPAASRRAVPA